MKLTGEEKRTLSEVRMKKSFEFLDDAKASLEQKRLRTAVSRAYYSALNAARALLILEGSNPETHEGIITMLSLHFVKKGLLPVEVIKNYKFLLAVRKDVDYGDFDEIDFEDAENAVKKCERIVAQIDALRKKLLEEM